MNEKQLIAIITKYLLGKGIPSKYLYSNLAHVMVGVCEAMVNIELGRMGLLDENKN